MTPGERKACAVLLKSSVGVSSSGSGDSEDAENESETNPLDAINAAGDITNNQDEDDPFVDCSFVGGSSAEVERVWSMSNRVLSPCRAAMHPINLEAIMFLKHNTNSWGYAEVQEAMDMTLQELGEDQQANVASEDEDEEDIYEDDESI